MFHGLVSCVFHVWIICGLGPFWLKILWCAHDSFCFSHGVALTARTQTAGLIQLGGAPAIRFSGCALVAAFWLGVFLTIVELLIWID